MLMVRHFSVSLNSGESKKKIATIVCYGRVEMDAPIKRERKYGSWSDTVIIELLSR